MPEGWDQLGVQGFHMWNDSLRARGFPILERASIMREERDG